MSNTNDTKVDREILKKIGKVQNNFPVDHRPYDPLRPNGSAGIVAQQTAPKQFDFGIVIK